MACLKRGWLVLVVLLFAVIRSAAAEPKRVLILHSYGPHFAPWVFVAGHFREELFKLSPDKIDLYEASLEGARFQQADELHPLIEYLTALFGSRKLDLIVTIGAPAAIFVQKYRAEFFPSTPLLFGGPEQRTVNRAALTPNDAAVLVGLDFTQWIENVLRVLPDTKHFVWILGASPLEQFWVEEFRRVSQPFADRVSFEWLNELTFEDMQKRLSQLPPHSAAFFVDIRIDAAGIPLDRESVLPKLRAATNAPIFGYVDNYLGHGIVGGPLMSSGEVGGRIAEAAVRILKGEAPADLNIPPMTAVVPQYDWRELQHWNISEDHLPPGSIVRFREPGVWQQYRAPAAFILALILLQGALISALLLERRGRQRAEVQSARRTAQLAHVNRFAMAGELTAAIAHEINQPLGAMLTNTETAQLIASSPAPDMHEINEILADIRRDNERASSIIHRLRSLLKRTPFELKEVDLAELVRETGDLLSRLAAAREVKLDSVVQTSPLPIKGDRIQLQQVFINLMTNAMDMMSERPGALRAINIIAKGVDGFATVSVSDTGPGIPPEKLKTVFEPFFTTKANGMGMGLSIARTIVESHGGQLIAENKPEGGAIFSVRLPLVSPAI
jgi:signal transduction histidine kinase